jgi:RNA polymerase sigma-70 factor (ECF subfamily)
MFEVPATIQAHTKAAIHGDSAALGIVFQFYRPRLLAHALRICGNTPLAQDAVQDAFISALTHLTALRDSNLFYPWMKKILVNRCYQLLKNEKSIGFEENMERNDFLLRQTIDEKFEKTANLQQLYKALMFLSNELKVCILLRYFSEFNSYEDIALILGVPVGTVRSRLSAAREKLSQKFIQVNDADDKALAEAKRWSDFYFEHWHHLYEHAGIRDAFFNHLHPALNIRFTSGKQEKGRALLESEISNDLIYGSRTSLTQVTSSGTISVVEGVNTNHPDYPDRCAPFITLVLFRQNDIVNTAHIFDSPRP